MITRENCNVITFTAVDGVIAGAAYDGVIAGATINDIITKAIGERIGPIATKHRNGDIPYNLYVVDVILAGEDKAVPVKRYTNVAIRKRQGLDTSDGINVTR